MSSLCAVQSDIRAILEAAVGTPTQRLIAILEAAGITATAELAKLIGVCDRAVRKARNSSSSGTTVPPRNSSSAQTGTPVPPEGVARVEDNNITNNLEPTVVDSKKLPPPRTSRDGGGGEEKTPAEIALDEMISSIAGWGNMPEANARQWLMTTVRVYGQEPVARAYHALKTKLATGDLIAQPLRLWGSLAAAAKDHRQTSVPRRSVAEEKARAFEAAMAKPFRMEDYV